MRVNDRHGVWQPSFAGNLHVKLSHSPTGTERLWKESDGQGGHDGDDEDHIISGVYSAPLVQGETRFSSLYVNTAGENYRLRFLLTVNTGQSIATTYSEPFTVEVGEPFQIGVIASPSLILGGTAFQAIASIRDKGFNTVQSVNEGTVSVLSTFIPVDEVSMCMERP